MQCFDYSLLSQLSQQQKQGRENVVIKHSEGNRNRKAARKYSVNEIAAST